jgi:hypothetical protein
VQYAKYNIRSEEIGSCARGDLSPLRAASIECGPRWRAIFHRSARLIDEITGYPLAVRLPRGGLALRIKAGQGHTILVIYGLGYAAVCLVFALLYVRAYRRRAALGLDPDPGVAYPGDHSGERHSDGDRPRLGEHRLGGGERRAGTPGFVYVAVAPALTAKGM